jgi:hypothetical protein
MRRGWQALSGFWETDRSLSTLLLLLVVSALVLPPLLPEGRGKGPVGDLVFSLLLLSGMVAVWRERRWVVRLVVGFALVALPIRWAAFLAPEGALPVWSVATSVVAFGLLALVVLAKVLRPGMITAHRLQGAVAAYLLFGLVWAKAYEWIFLTYPGAFAGALGGEDGRSPWVYYSLVTLTTMGYGDITPVHPLARSLAVGEALTGQLYLAILISRLVALELESRKAA